MSTGSGYLGGHLWAKFCHHSLWMPPYTNFGISKVNKIRFFFLVFKKSSVHFISSKSYHFHMKGIKAHSLNRLFFFWQYYFVEKTTKYLFLRQNWHHILHWYVDCRYRLFIGKKSRNHNRNNDQRKCCRFFLKIRSLEWLGIV